MAKRKRQIVVLSDDDAGDGSQLSTPFKPQDEQSPFQRVEKDMAFLCMSDSKETSVSRSESHLWTEKYRPKTVSTLAGNTKKIRELKQWLEAQLDNPVGYRSRVLLLTGPSGVGKKTAVRVIVDSMDLELCEWSAPTPVLWREHLHHAHAETPYCSKLEDFESFLESSRKYPCLSSTDTKLKTKVILVDDLPHVNLEEKKRHLCTLLYELALGGQFPTIVVMTDMAEDGQRGKGLSRLTTDIIQALESGGAAKLAFNPITVNAIRKVLGHILKTERYQLPSERVSEVAEIAAGDIRHAILLLQYTCLNRQRTVAAAPSKRRRSSGKQIGCSSLSAADEERSREPLESNCGRDQVLSLFHALGKFLYNKRIPEDVSESGEELSYPLKQQYQRQQPKVRDPELVISQAHAESSTLLCFLHENIPDFVDDDAIEDVAEALQYISDADQLAARFTWHGRKPLLDAAWTNTSQLGEAAAASVAARGILYSNTHPAPRRWQTLRSPALWQVERSKANKKRELFGLLREVSTEPVVYAAEFLPFIRMIQPPMNTRPESEQRTDEDDIEDSD